MQPLAVTAIVLLATFVQLAPVAPIAPIAPDFDFTRTIRVDYFHSGGPGGEVLELDAVIAEGEWPGSRTQLIDTTGFGKYLLEVIDPSSNRVLYSRGFATIYGEWETTPEFRAKARTFHESVRFPRPNAPVRVAIKRSEEHTSELQSQSNLVCRLLLRHPPRPTLFPYTTLFRSTTGFGKYLLEVIDPSSNRVLYSRGFATIYGEWETTPEFRAKARTFHESVRFPRPDAPVRVAIKARDRQNVFRPLWERDVDPRAAVASTESRGHLLTLFENAPPSRAVDLLLISAGYSSAEAPKFQADAERLLNALFMLEPFKSRRTDFNVRALHVPASPVPVEFNIFGLERYALTYDNRALRETAAAAPYDVVEILVNDTKYGGGSIFNQQSTVAVGSEFAPYVFIHELAHSLAALADEYVGSVPYETGAVVKVEPWEPNITALHDASALKWRDLVEPGTPLPTPLSHAGKVGAFEGAGYEARGLYRPEAEEHTSELQSQSNLVCRLLLEKKKKKKQKRKTSTLQ